MVEVLFEGVAIMILVRFSEIQMMRRFSRNWSGLWFLGEY